MNETKNPAPPCCFCRRRHGRSCYPCPYPCPCPSFSCPSPGGVVKVPLPNFRGGLGAVMMDVMASDLTLRSLSLAYLTTPLSSSIFLTIESNLSLVFSLSLSDNLGLFPIYFHYPNREFILPSISMVVYSCSLWISSSSLYVPDLKLLALLMAAAILVQFFSLASSNRPSSV